jgi:homocysteine S-methyltransferase
MTSPFLARLASGVILADGAMGTELSRRGGTWQRSSAEANLENPELVLAIHRDYVEAGSELLRTNTFTANSARMDPGLAREAILQGVGLARSAAGSGRLVAGSVGPLADLALDPSLREATYLEQCLALAEGGCDLLVLETFQDLGDLAGALRMARATGLPLVAQVALADLGPDRIRQIPADVVGINCIDPDLAVRAVERLGPGRRSAFPSAGLPGESGYPVSPAQFAQGMDRLRSLGARLVGGCCGTGPDHLRAAAGRVGG